MRLFVSLKSEKIWLSSIGLILMVCLFLALSLLNGLLFKPFQFDMTSKGVYSFPKETKSYLQSIKTPLDAYFYINKEALKGTNLESYSQQILHMLMRLQRESKGKIHIHVIDPKPFSNDEDNARIRGVSKVKSPEKKGDMFFGLSLINNLDERFSIPFFSIKRRDVLAYDLLSLVFRASEKTQSKVGYYSVLPMGDRYNPYASPAPFPPQQTYLSLKESYNLQSLSVVSHLDARALDSLDALLMIQPDNAISENDAMLLEKFMDRGGKLVLFLDPISEYLSKETYSLPLMKVLANDGVYFFPDRIVADLDYPKQITLKNTQATHYGVFSAKHFNPKSPISSGLSSVNFSSAGHLILSPSSKELQITPLAWSSKNSYSIKKQYFKALLGKAPPPGYQKAEEKILAVKILGKVKPLFYKPKKGKKLRVNLTLVSDTSWLSDRLWLQGNHESSYPISDNLSFLMNIMDEASGLTTLLPFRRSKSIIRPFETIETLKIKAKARLRKEESLLQKQIEGIQNKLAGLESLRIQTHNHAITPERAKTMDELKRKLDDFRLKIRGKRHMLYQGIQRIYKRLRLFMIFFSPFLLLLIGAFAVIRRRRRRLSHLSSKSSSL